MKAFFKKIIIWKLTLEARMLLALHKPVIIAITGTVGKTSTKEAVYAGLAQSFHSIRKSEKSFNSEIGVPLTVLDLPNAWGSLNGWTVNLLKGFGRLFSSRYPQVLVVEAGIDRPGDMKKLTSWLKPDVAVFTRFSKNPVHVEFFNSPEAVIAEKSLLAKALKPGGQLILNYDDEDVMELKRHTDRECFTYGFDPEADIYASNEQIFYSSDGRPQGMNFKVNIGGNSIPVNISGGLGRQHIYPALAAFAVGVARGVNPISIAQGVQAYELLPGRMHILNGKNDSTIIDDTYNSSPLAANAALDVLKTITNASRKIAVLGNMAELGSLSTSAHRELGEQASFADLLVCVGELTKEAVEGAIAAGMRKEKVVWFTDSKEAAAFLSDKISKGDIVLIKGSQSARMERVTKALLAHPEEAKKLLVRQEAEWEKR